MSETSTPVLGSLGGIGASSVARVLLIGGYCVESEHPPHWQVEGLH